jgi:hypothetical protein
MIVYNHPQRGAYEYDKFILNTLQMTNEIKKIEREMTTGGLGGILQLKSDIDTGFNALTGESGLNSRLAKILEAYGD